MRRGLMIVMMMLLLSSNAFAGRMFTQEVISSGGKTMAIASGNVIYTNAFSLVNGEYFGLEYQVTSPAGTPNVTIEFEQSWRLPVTEYASDTNWVEPDNMADIVTNLTTETVHLTSISPIPMPYGRFKITDNSGSIVTDQIASMVLVIVEKE